MATGRASTSSQSHSVTDPDRPVHRQWKAYPPTTNTANTTTAANCSRPHRARGQLRLPAVGHSTGHDVPPNTSDAVTILARRVNRAAPARRRHARAGSPGGGRKLVPHRVVQKTERGHAGALARGAATRARIPSSERTAGRVVPVSREGDVRVHDMSAFRCRCCGLHQASTFGTDRAGFHRCARCAEHADDTIEALAARDADHAAMYHHALIDAQDEALLAQGERDHYHTKMQAAYSSREVLVQVLAQIDDLHHVRGKRCSCGRRGCRVGALLADPRISRLIRSMTRCGARCASCATPTPTAGSRSGTTSTSRSCTRRAPCFDPWTASRRGLSCQLSRRRRSRAASVR